MLVDGIHDLGGMQGFRAVAHAPAEPVFYHEWEAVAVLCWWPWLTRCRRAAASSGIRLNGWSRGTT